MSAKKAAKKPKPKAAKKKAPPKAKKKKGDYAGPRVKR